MVYSSIAVEMIIPIFIILIPASVQSMKRKRYGFLPHSQMKQKKLKASFELIDVTEHDANLFA